MMLAKRLGRLTDLALAREKDERVARSAGPPKLINGMQDRLLHLQIFLLRILRLRRPIANLDRIRAARDHDDWRVVEVLAESLRIDCRRRDDQLQVRALWHKLLEVADEKIDVKRPLVGFVEDN